MMLRWSRPQSNLKIRLIRGGDPRAVDAGGRHTHSA